MSKKVAFVIFCLVVVLGLAVWALATYQPEKGSESTVKEPFDTFNMDSPDKKDDSKGVSAKEAEEIVLKEFGGEIKETGSDDYKDIPAWEVEVRNSREGRIEVKVDKATGKILHWEHDD